MNILPLSNTMRNVLITTLFLRQTILLWIKHQTRNVTGILFLEGVGFQTLNTNLYIVSLQSYARENTIMFTQQNDLRPAKISY